MRLADRLALTKPLAAAPEAPGSAGPSPLAAALSALSRRVTPRPDVDTFACNGPPPTLGDALPGVAMASRSGQTTWVATSRHPIASLHGAFALGPLEPFGPGGEIEHLFRLTGDPRLLGFAPDKALFLDIEATGLEHGAGTLAFMIGLGHIDMADREVVVTQLILRDPDEERAQLELLWDLVDAFPYLVSFNGKSFDLSVLQSRLVMNRLCTPREGELKLRPHLDLLHLSRSLYRGAFEDTRLQTLERKLLGFERVDDMPGALAPSCFFHWLRDGDPRPLAMIAEHNRFDVLSMVALTRHLAEVSRPVGDASRGSALWLNLARTYLRRKEPEATLAVLDAPPTFVNPDELDEALSLEVVAARRCKAEARQRQALERLAARHPDNEAHQRALSRLAGRRTGPRSRARATTAS